MRLAYLTSRFPYARLGETFLTPEIRRLASLCDELHVIATRPLLRRSAFGETGAFDARIPLLAPGTFVQAAIETLSHPVQAVRVCGSVLFAQSSAGARLKNLLLLPKALAVARYVRTHRIEHIHAGWLTTPASVAYIAARMTGVSWSCTAHAHDIFSQNMLDRKRDTARFIRFIAERNRGHFLRASVRQGASARVLHLGVDIPAQPAPSSEARRLHVLCPARLDPIKGHRYLLEAVALARAEGETVTCDIAGDGPLRDSIRAGIRELGLEQSVTLLGAVAHSALLDRLQSGRYDAVVLASLEFDAAGKHEGIPVALIEGMAAGVPCIATATGCIGELIEPSNGVLVEQRDPGALAAAMIDLARRPEHRRSLGIAARARAAAEFDAVRTADRLYEWMRAACGEETAGGHASTAPATRPASMPAANPH